jgi:hypothetical protein
MNSFGFPPAAIQVSQTFRSRSSSSRSCGVFRLRYSGGVGVNRRGGRGGIDPLGRVIVGGGGGTAGDKHPSSRAGAIPRNAHTRQLDEQRFA